MVFEELTKIKVHESNLKIIQPTYDNVASYESLYRCGQECMDGLYWKPSVQQFNLNLPSNIARLSHSLYDGTFKSFGFNYFVIVERGKLRHINAVRIDERAVQKSLSYAIKACIVPRLTLYNSATLANRGTGYCLYNLKQQLNQISLRYGAKNCYIIILDYHGYYDSINHNILLNQYANYIADERVYELAAYFIRCFSLMKNDFNSAKTPKSKIPTIEEAKRMGLLDPNYIFNDQYLNFGLSTEPGYDALSDYTDKISEKEYEMLKEFIKETGVGLGSEISQISGVMYGNHLYHALSEVYKVDNGQYMDDSYLISNDKERLKEARDFLIEESKKLGLTYGKIAGPIRLTDVYYFLKKKIHVTETGKVLMQLSDTALAKHYRIIKNHYERFCNGSLDINYIFFNFYNWRQSNKYLDSRNDLIKLNNEFLKYFKDYLSPSQKKSLYAF